MASKWIEMVTGPLEQKKQYKNNVARLQSLKPPYAEAAAALQRYFLYQGGVTDGDTLVTMLGDLAELFEDAAEAGTALREIVGENPVEFAEEFTAAYGGQRWIDKERARLIEAIDQAERKEERH
ncbi:DUF1048 domain-containing protein [Glutamicibacter sp. NPDC087344]|uniref:DUF1048 domain-containing protein n=1 Tax=Glutamicibacter sp. NPDC087344 TaxID=3363994 RepID=UPI00382810F4